MTFFMFYRSHFGSSLSDDPISLVLPSIFPMAFFLGTCVGDILTGLIGEKRGQACRNVRSAELRKYWEDVWNDYDRCEAERLKEEEAFAYSPSFSSAEDSDDKFQALDHDPWLQHEQYEITAWKDDEAFAQQQEQVDDEYHEFEAEQTALCFLNEEHEWCADD